MALVDFPLPTLTVPADQRSGSHDHSHVLAVTILDLNRDMRDSNPRDAVRRVHRRFQLIPVGGLRSPRKDSYQLASINQLGQPVFLLNAHVQFTKLARQVVGGLVRSRHVNGGAEFNL